MLETVVMPQLTVNSKPAKVWFDFGMIYFEDPENIDGPPCKCSIDEYEERIHTLRDMIKAQEDLYGEQVKLGKRVIPCSMTEFDKFFSAAKELLKSARQEIHIGMPIQDMFESVKSSHPVSHRQGFEKVTEGGIILP